MTVAHDVDEYLIHPDELHHFDYKQFQYFMDGYYMGEFYLTVDMNCQFRPQRTGITSEPHGRWEYCTMIRAIKCKFDYAGDKKRAKYKWTFFRGRAGIDYLGRQIYVIPTAVWHKSATGVGAQRTELETSPPPAPPAPADWQVIRPASTDYPEEFV